MIRIGMNKKTGEPINKDFPFYYKINNLYTPCSSLSFGNSVRIIYGRVNEQKRIVWIEANDWVEEQLPAKRYTKLISIKEKVIINNDQNNLNDDVCIFLDKGKECTFKSCLISGPCNLIYDDRVWLETDSEFVKNE